jgi:excisionase family DNA binding protein
VRSHATDPPTSPDEDELLTTGEAARVLDASRQHVVDLCERGDLPFISIGRHRRVRRADLDALMSRTSRMSRDQLRILWLGRATAAKVVEIPHARSGRPEPTSDDYVRSIGRGGAQRWLDEWDGVLRGPVEGVLDVPTSRTPRARELRQNTPFAGVLTDEERQQVLQAFRETHPRRRREAG